MKTILFQCGYTTQFQITELEKRLHIIVWCNEHYPHEEFHLNVIRINYSHANYSTCLFPRSILNSLVNTMKSFKAEVNDTLEIKLSAIQSTLLHPIMDSNHT